MYDNYKGSILINNIELKQLDINDYRKNINVVFQDFYQFEMTLREIITMKNNMQDVTDEKLLFCLKNVGLNNKVLELPKGLDTNIGKYFGG